MKTPRDTVRLWQFLAFLAIASTVLSLASLHSVEPLVVLAGGGGPCDTNPTCGELSGTFTCADGRHVQSNFDCDDLCQGGQSDGTPCATFDSNLCLEVVCGAGACGDSVPFIPSSCKTNCTVDSCDVCANNCSGACVHQPDLSPGALYGPVTCADGRHVDAPFHCNDLCAGEGLVGTLCATFDSHLCVEAVCGSAGECGNAMPFVPPSCNDNNNCTIDSCDMCANNRSGACVHQPDLNATGCNLAPGEPCSAIFQCASTFCVDGVCCNSACDGPSEACNLPGSVGQCVTAAAPAPVVSGRGVLIIGCLLTAIGLLSLRRAVRRPRG